MSARAYHITLTSLTECIELGVIAQSTINAIRIGISLMPACFAPTGITCKPAGGQKCTNS